MDNFIVGFGQNVNEYKINGVRYIVESRFEPVDFRRLDQNTRIDQRLEHYITGDFADFSTAPEADTMVPGYVCSAAGKED